MKSGSKGKINSEVNGNSNSSGSGSGSGKSIPIDAHGQTAKQLRNVNLKPSSNAH